MKNQTNHPRHHVALILTLVGLMSVAALLLGLTRFATAQAVAASWRYTGNLNSARSNHTATLLLNGKVLITGGGDNGRHRTLASAELYDPITGTWTSTGNLNTAREKHTATLLSNGKVLVTGGERCSPAPCFFLNSAELYDPANGTWSITGSLNTFRAEHTATLLQNGKVLIAGSFTDTAELYDPATEVFAIAGKLTTGLLLSTATLLPDGKILVAGGYLDLCGLVCPVYLPSNRAELYDPATGMWSNTGNLNMARYNHRATLLANGKVLVAGFFNENAGASNSAELYDPASGTWSNTGDLMEALGAQTATLLPNGQVLTAGGISDFGNVSRAESYDPATGIWTTSANLNTSRHGHTATLLPNGKVLVTGGSGDNTAELYDPGTGPISIDDAQFFVRQQYLDFLNRQPDTDGLAFWTDEFTLCGTGQQCIEAKRINVSASFFLSIEFQQTGYLVYRFYKASYGNLPGAPVPVKLSEFLPDMQKIGQGVIVNQAGWETVLENNKQGFLAEFVQRSRFTSAYPTSLPPGQFVDQLFMNAGVTPSATDRAAAINEFGSATTTADGAARARALRRVAENSILAQQEFNRGFVLMQYFGYLRRNPNDAPEATLDFAGYNFWLNKLNSFNGNFVNAEMVKAFISSSEYRRRFEP